MTIEDKVRKIISQIIIHCFLILVVATISSILLILWEGYFTDVGFSKELYNFLWKWIIWIFEDLSAESFIIDNYLKFKSLLIILFPFFVASIFYIKFKDKIYSINFVKKKESIYGDARWANEEDIKRAKLRCKEGMMLGVDDNGYYIADGYQHALIFAPTGSGKGVGFVIPNLLYWTQSIIVHDIKLENYLFCSGYRASIGQKVYVWEPSNPDGVTHCYNPLDFISKKPGQMVDDIQKIANLLMVERDMWNNEARSLFLGVVLCLIADPKKLKSFGEVTRTLRSDDVTYNLAVCLDTLGESMHPVGYMNLNAFLQKADKERSGVISTLNSSLELWANPLIDAATAKSDFSFMDIKKTPHTIFVGLTPDNIQRLQKLMQVFYQQSMEFLSRKLPDKSEPYGVMYLMDEFPTVGKMEQFKAGIAFLRGYNVRLFLVVQDTQQLKGLYEEAGMNSFLSNSTFRITYAANNIDTAKLISDLCGNKTVESESFSRSSIPKLSVDKSVNVSMASRALLLPQEVMQLPKDEQIVLIESFPPIRSKKIIYYKDPFFTKRLLPATFIPTQEPYDPRDSLYSDDAESIEIQD